MPLELPDAWRTPLANVTRNESFASLDQFVSHQRATTAIYPPEDQVFAALSLTPPDRVKAVIVGQDPYHGPGQAHGLAFSVPTGTPPPPSLKNLLRELRDDLGRERTEVDLTGWAREGVLLLNTVLTVRAGEAGSHRKKGWEALTDGILSTVAASRAVAVMLWGADAHKKQRLFAGTRSHVILGVHPSPLSAHRGFFGSRPFSAVDAALVALGETPIDWWRETATS